MRQTTNQNREALMRQTKNPKKLRREAKLAAMTPSRRRAATSRQAARWERVADRHDATQRLPRAGENALSRAAAESYRDEVWTPGTLDAAFGRAEGGRL
jgi:hypothetical protein